MKPLCTILFLAVTLNLLAQDAIPQDYLPASFHKQRREILRSKLPKNSVAVVFANPIRNRANDVDYVYHQDPNFYYLTGYKEPHAVVLVFSETQQSSKGNYNEVLFVQERNPNAEQWTGKRLGVEGAKEKLKFSVVYNGKDFKNFPIDFSSFNSVLFFNFNNDYRDSKYNTADLSDLINQFKEKINFNPNLVENPIKKKVYELITSTTIENNANVAQIIGRAVTAYPDLKNDKLIEEYAVSKDEKTRLELKEKAIKIAAEKPKSNNNTNDLAEILAEMRQVKTSEELKLLTKAIRISAQGQIEVMKALHANMTETEVQGIHEFVYKKYGCEYEGYPSIVGAGNNGCVLHYIENNKTNIKDQLILMDLGAEYRGYTADVTRTIPVSGSFTKAQKQIYDLVYQAQEAGIKAATIGNPFSAPDAASRAVINKGLIALGIIKNEGEARQYFPHGTSHYLGLDVHDPGNYGTFKENEVITVEPGIYIPEGSNCDTKWHGIAVRIEDDILITKKGPVNLSEEAPRKAEDIEALMQKKSPLDNFILPHLD